MTRAIACVVLSGTLAQAYRMVAQEHTTASSKTTESAPTLEERHAEFYQCDRQCRWAYGFFDRGITGKQSGKKCVCFKDNVEMDKPAVLRFEKKTFDTENTWSGGTQIVGDHEEQYGFDSPYVCVEKHDGTLATLNKDDATASPAAFKQILHCGVCQACSAPKDIEVIARTRSWITEHMTAVSAKFAAPWGHGNETRLADDLEGIGFDVSRERPDGNNELPTCMDCWVDNIMCDAMSCKDKCWVKFFNPANAKTEIEGDIGLFDFNAQCLACDEANCGPEFIKCAGANRRSSGIESDIARPDNQKCKVGMYFGKTPEEVPTDPKPTSAYVKEVLDLKNGVTIRGEDASTFQEIEQSYRCCCQDGTCKWYHNDLTFRGFTGVFSGDLNCPRTQIQDDGKVCARRKCMKFWDDSCKDTHHFSSEGTNVCKATRDTKDATAYFQGELCEDQFW